MFKKTNISAIVGVVAILAVLIIAGVVYAVPGDVEQAINNYFGDTTVNQNIEVSDDAIDMGISDQSGGFVITKTVTNSDIATTTPYTGLDITNAISGSLVLDEMIVSANNTSIAGCTGLVIRTDTATGEGDAASTTVMAITAIASIAANETIDFDNADTAIKTMIQDGGNLQVLPTDNPCTGDGELTFTMFFKKVDERSHIYD